MLDQSSVLNSQLHISILKRAGGILLTVGLIDIAVMIYCIISGISYSSSFNIFAVIAGIFLLRGSLRAASLVRWLAVFMLSAFITLLIAFPFMQPVELTLAQFRLKPGASTATMALMTFVAGFLFWLARELGRNPIRDARASEGRNQRDMRIPVVVGVGLVFVGSIFSMSLLGGESGTRAKSMAEQQIGKGYSLHVTSLDIIKGNRGTFVSAVVTAWNDEEIKNIPVRWEEQ